MSSSPQHSSIKNKALLFVVILCSMWAIGGVAYAYFTINYTNKPIHTKNDAIVVLTGGAHRINTAFSMLLKGNASHLFISGVYEGNSLEVLVSASSLNDKDKNNIRHHCCITLDYEAHTTVQNAMESIKWLTKHHFKNVIIVTSDYHILRTELLFQHLAPKNITFQYYGVASYSNKFEYSYWQNIFTEYHKMLVTAAYWLVDFTRRQHI